MPNPILTFAFNTITLPSLIKYYNAFQAIPPFLVIVKFAFIKYLKETRKNLIKYITYDKYNDLISQLIDLNYKACLQAEYNAKLKAKCQQYIREDIHPEL